MSDHAPATAGRRIALIAHDNKKRDMLEWAEYNLDLLAGHELFATATTGHLLQQLGLPVKSTASLKPGRPGGSVGEGMRGVGLHVHGLAGPRALVADRRASPRDLRERAHRERPE